MAEQTAEYAKLSKQLYAELTKSLDDAKEYVDLLLAKDTLATNPARFEMLANAMSDVRETSALRRVFVQELGDADSVEDAFVAVADLLAREKDTERLAAAKSLYLRLYDAVRKARS